MFPVLFIRLQSDPLWLNSDQAAGCGFAFGPCRPSGRLQRVIDEVDDEARRDQDHPEGERTHIPDLLMLAADHREAQQQHGRNADGDGSEQAAGHAERTLQFRLAEAQHRQRHEFQEQAGAIEKDVDA